MLFAALFNAVCLYNAYFCHWLLQMLFVIMLCLGLLTHSLFISSIILHRAQCFQSVGFPNAMLTPFFTMKVYVLSDEIAHKDNHYYYY